MTVPAPAKLSVLLADDTPEIRRMLGLHLQSLGFSVTCVETGEDAIREVKRNYFDLIVTDMLMPGADGIEVMAEVRRSYPTTRIVVITGGGSALDPQLCVRLAKGLGAHATLVKPFLIEQFREVLNAILPTQVEADRAADGKECGANRS